MLPFRVYSDEHLLLSTCPGDFGAAVHGISKAGAQETWALGLLNCSLLTAGLALLRVTQNASGHLAHLLHRRLLTRPEQCSVVVARPA